MRNARKIAKTLQRIIPEEQVLTSDRIPAKYRFDALRPYRPYPKLRTKGYAPKVLVQPKTPEEVIRIVRAARKMRTPVVPYGGGTGLMGAAIAVRGGVMIDTSQMNSILTVSKDDMVVRAEAGVILEDVYNRLENEELLFAHDPWTRPVATLGGAISTNSLGYLGARYGSIGNQLLAIEAVTPDGSRIVTRAAQFASTGFDLRRLFVGTEGMFGLVTSAVVRAFPLPERFALASYGFSNFSDGYHAIADLRVASVRPSMIDFGGDYPDSSEAQLNLAFDGLDGEVDAQLKKADEIATQAGGRKLSDHEAQEFWDTRHDIALLYKQRVSKEFEGEDPHTKYDYIHVALPSSKVLSFHEGIHRIASHHGVKVLEVGLWHGPELVSIVLTATATEPAKATRKLWMASNAIIERAQDLGGCMEFCHGVGLKLAHLMRREHGEGLELMRRIKGSLDPLGIMNPGKESL